MTVSRRALGIALAAALPTVSATAGESVVFTYDALGRLTQATTTGGVNDAQTIVLTSDLADNRIGKTLVGGATGGIPDVTVIVLPINGFTVLPLLTAP